MRIVGVLVLLAVLAVGGWFVATRVLMRPPADIHSVEVSPEAAARAEEKLLRLQQGDEVRLTGVEFTSLMRYRQGEISEALRDPVVSFNGDTIVLAGSLAADELPDVDEINRIRMILPDTTSVSVIGHLRPLDAGRAAFDVASVEVARIPIPSRFYPPVLERIGRRDEAGLGPTAVAIRLPPGAASARVEDGHLVLTPSR
jgi:hypothetical protein